MRDDVGAGRRRNGGWDWERRVGGRLRSLRSLRSLCSVPHALPRRLPRPFPESRSREGEEERGCSP